MGDEAKIGDPVDPKDLGLAVANSASGPVEDAAPEPAVDDGQLWVAPHPVYVSSAKTLVPANTPFSAPGAIPGALWVQYVEPVAAEEGEQVEAEKVDPADTKPKRRGR